MKTLAIAGAAAALLLLSSAAGEARPMHMCPMIYQPVCAVTPSGHRKTFSNRCMARNAHARVLYSGRCRWRR